MSPSTKLDQAVLWKLKLDTWGLYLDRLMFPSSQKDKNKTAEFVDKHHMTGFKENRKINTIKYIPSFQSSAKLSGGDSSQEWRCSLDTQLFNQLTQKTKKGGGKYRAESGAEDKLSSVPHHTKKPCSLWNTNIPHCSVFQDWLPLEFYNCTVWNTLW